jgi:hypothetical protein
MHAELSSGGAAYRVSLKLPSISVIMHSVCSSVWTPCSMREPVKLKRRELVCLYACMYAQVVCV